MEQNAIFESLRCEPGEAWNAPFDTVSIPSLRCPSDKSGFQDGNVNYGTANIMVSAGDAVFTGYPWHPWSPWTIDSDIAGWGDTNNHRRGVFTTYMEKSFGDISDGTSNTIAISEAVSVDVRGSKRVKGGTTANWSWTDAITDGIGPQNCLNRRDPSDPTQFTGDAAWCFRGTGGIFEGIASSFLFSTVLPPNSPSCQQGTTADANFLGSATSNHTGGVLVGLCDGSIRFVTDSIDCGDLTRGQKIPGGGMWSGESRYGVWGALGTPSGGESKSL